MTLTFEQTEEDYIDFNYYYNWVSPAKKWARLRLRLLPLSFFLIMAIPSVVRQGGFSKAEIALLLVGLIFALLATSYVKWRNQKRIDKLIKSGKNTDLAGFRRIDFEPDRVKLSTSHAESAVKWESLEKLEETDKHLFLFVTVNQALIIPKRIFQSEAELIQVREYIQEKLPR